MSLKQERGVMIYLGDKAWGTVGSGAHSYDGWLDPADATIYDPRHMKHPEDASANPYKRDHLRAGHLRPVIRLTCVCTEGEQSGLTDLAMGLAKAVALDEQPEEGGFDLSAGMFGSHVSAWLREIALKLETKQHEH